MKGAWLRLWLTPAPPCRKWLVQGDGAVSTASKTKAFEPCSYLYMVPTELLLCILRCPWTGQIHSLVKEDRTVRVLCCWFSIAERVPWMLSAPWKWESLWCHSILFFPSLGYGENLSTFSAVWISSPQYISTSALHAHLTVSLRGQHRAWCTEGMILSTSLLVCCHASWMGCKNQSLTFACLQLPT